jgi:hypothetical protein
MICRKMLMNVAVDKGAKEGKSFWEYIKYLQENHCTPPNSDDWIKHIKDKGNELNHQIAFASEDDAQNLIRFCWSLLYFLYEMAGSSNP